MRGHERFDVHNSVALKIEAPFPGSTIIHFELKEMTAAVATVKPPFLEGAHPSIVTGVIDGAMVKSDVAASTSNALV